MIPAALAAALVLATAGPAASQQAPPGAEPTLPALVLLPLQDRMAAPETAAAVETALRGELAGSYRVAESGLVRTAMRRARLREVRAMPPAMLERLRDDLGIDQFLSVTLYRADDGESPRLCLAARLFVAGETEVSWSGFQAVSGVDGGKMLGRGRIDEFAILTTEAVRRLVADLRGERLAPRWKTLQVPDLYLREGFSAAALGTIAVIPFDVEAELGGVAEILTDLGYTTLHRNGLTLASPGLVREILFQRGVLLRGEVDAMTRAALRATTGADTFFTGSVERYESSFLQSAERYDVPQWSGTARIAFSARLVDARSGRILWMGGIEARTPPADVIFPRHRPGSAEQLAERMMESLVASFAAAGAESSPGGSP